MELMPPRAHTHRGTELRKHRLDPVNEKKKKILVIRSIRHAGC